MDLVTFSYSLTMIPDWFAAIDNACALLANEGTLGVVDFYVARKHPEAGLRAHGWLQRTFWCAVGLHSGLHSTPSHRERCQPPHRHAHPHPPSLPTPLAAMAASGRRGLQTTTSSSAPSRVQTARPGARTGVPIGQVPGGSEAQGRPWLLLCTAREIAHGRAARVVWSIGSDHVPYLRRICPSHTLHERLANVPYVGLVMPQVPYYIYLGARAV